MAGLDPPRALPARLIWRARRHFAVRRYLTGLPRKLIDDYGHRGPYRPQQVAATIGRNESFSTEFAPLAQALFCDEESLRNAWREAGFSAEIRAVRRDLAEAWFGGVSGNGDNSGTFTYADVGRYSAEQSWAESHGGGSGGDAGHHGGDGGHGGH
jgi:hypothetical protein